jgi:hypothetical protein
METMRVQLHKARLWRVVLLWLVSVLGIHLGAQQNWEDDMFFQAIMKEQIEKDSMESMDSIVPNEAPKSIVAKDSTEATINRAEPTVQAKDSLQDTLMQATEKLQATKPIQDSTKGLDSDFMAQHTSKLANTDLDTLISIVSKKESTVDLAVTDKDLGTTRISEIVVEKPEIERVNREEMKKIIGLQNDPIRGAAAVQGVANMSDMSAKPMIRGGDPAHTRVTWMGIPIDNPYHVTSFYSIFNAINTQEVTVRRDYIPASEPSALSGLVDIVPRIPSLEEYNVDVEMSTLRGALGIMGPVWKEKVAAWVTVQDYWYRWVVNSGLAFAEKNTQTPELKKQIGDFNDLVDLPGFYDVQWGAMFKPHKDWQVVYQGIFAGDIIAVKNMESEYYIEGEQVEYREYVRHQMFEIGQDSIRNVVLRARALAGVDVNNTFQGIHAQYFWGQDWIVKSAVNWQKQDWSVDFAGGIVGAVNPGVLQGMVESGQGLRDGDLVFDLQSDNIHGRVAFEKEDDEGWQYSYGLGLDRYKYEYNLELPRVFYEAIYNGRMGEIYMMEFVPEDEKLILETDVQDIELRYFNLFNEIANRMDLSVKGRVVNNQLALFGDWQIPKNKNEFELGVRVEIDGYKRFFASPRFLWKSKRKPHAWHSGVGVYSQSIPELLVLVNAKKWPKSEKRAQWNGGYSYNITQNLTMTAGLHASYLWDLLWLQMYNTGEINVGGFMGAPGKDEGYVPMSYTNTEEYRKIFGQRLFSVKQGGVGGIAGLEGELVWTPVTSMKTGIRYEKIYSQRKDESNGEWYPFGKYPPWSVTWDMQFNPQQKYSVITRFQAKGGLPYTPIQSAATSWFNAASYGTDSLLVIGDRNSANLAPFYRMDVALQKQSTVWGLPAVYYAEVWNFLNTGNTILRDSGDWRILGVEMNFPIPIFYFGMRISL